MHARTRALWGCLVVWIAGCGDSPKRPLGATCEDDAQCASGLCVVNQCLDPAQDDDSDGLVNALEAGLGTNPLDADSDHDDKSDRAELDGNLMHVDTDRDGKPDAVESAKADADGDCIPDELDPDDGDGPGPGTIDCTVGPRDCEALFVDGTAVEDGRYTIDPDGVGGAKAFEVACLMSAERGGWTRWVPGVRQALGASSAGPREYLVAFADGRWLRSPPTTLDFAFTAGAALGGTWYYHRGTEDGAFACGDAAVPAVGLGCGGGETRVAASAGDATEATARVCVDGPAAVGTGDAACADATVWVRIMPCAHAAEDLVGDGGFADFLGAEAQRCWVVHGEPTAFTASTEVPTTGSGIPALRVATSSVTEPWETVLLGAETTLVAGRAYRLSFAARAEAARAILVVVQASDGTLFALRDVAVRTGWGQVELEFVPSVTTHFGRVELQLGGSGAAVSIDDLALVDLGPGACDPADGELLGNAGFGLGTACWKVEGKGGVLTRRSSEVPTEGDAPSLEVEPAGALTSLYDLTLQQSGLGLAGEHWYGLSFAVKGERAFTGAVTVQEPDGGAVTFDAEVSIAPTWTRASYEFLTGAESPSAALDLALGDVAGGKVWVDDVRMVDRGPSPCVPSGASDLLMDGDFVGGLLCWTPLVDASELGTLEVERGDGSPTAPSIRATVAESDPVAVHVAQEGFTLRSAASYRVQFVARADAARTLVVIVHNWDDFHQYHYEEVAIGTGWTPIALTFTADRDEPAGVFELQLGGPAGRIWIDAARLIAL